MNYIDKVFQVELRTYKKTLPYFLVTFLIFLVIFTVVFAVVFADDEEVFPPIASSSCSIIALFAMVGLSTNELLFGANNAIKSGVTRKHFLISHTASYSLLFLITVPIYAALYLFESTVLHFVYGTEIMYWVNQIQDDVSLPILIFVIFGLLVATYVLSLIISGFIMKFGKIAMLGLAVIYFSIVVGIPSFMRNEKFEDWYSAIPWQVLLGAGVAVILALLVCSIIFMLRFEVTH